MAFELPFCARAIWGPLSLRELKKFAFLAVIFHLLMAGYWMLRPLKEGIFFALVGIEYLPIARVLSFLVVMPVILAYTKLVDLLSRAQILYVVCSTFGTIFLASSFVLHYFRLVEDGEKAVLLLGDGTAAAIGWVIFFSIESYGSIVLSLFWAFVAVSTRAESAKKGYAIVVMGGQVGSIIGPLLATLSAIIGIPLLFVIASLYTLVSMLFVFVYMRVVERTPQKPKVLPLDAHFVDDTVGVLGEAESKRCHAGERSSSSDSLDHPEEMQENRPWNFSEQELDDLLDGGQWAISEAEWSKGDGEVETQHTDGECDDDNSDGVHEELSLGVANQEEEDEGGVGLADVFDDEQDSAEHSKPTRRQSIQKEKVVIVEEPKDASQNESTSIFAGFSLLLASPYLIGVLGISTIYEVIGTIMDFQMKLLARHTNPTNAEYTSFVASFGVAANLLSFVIAFLGTSSLLRHLGLRWCLFLFPVSVLVTQLLVLVYPNIVVVYFSQVSLKALAYALNNPTKEILYLPTSHSVKFKVKGTIDSVGARCAKALGAVITSCFSSSLHLLLVYGTGTGIGFVMLWFAAVFFVSTRFERMERERLRVEDVTPLVSDEERKEAE